MFKAIVLQYNGYCERSTNMCKRVAPENPYAACDMMCRNTLNTYAEKRVCRQVATTPFFR